MGKRISDDTIMALVLAGKNQTQISNELGMQKSTICRRINNDEFQERLSIYRKQALDNILNSLVANAQKSVNVLTDLLDNENEWIRLQAATKIISFTQDVIIQKDLMQEIEMWKQSKQYDYIE